MRTETFSVEGTTLVRSVVPDPARTKTGPYAHRCRYEDFLKIIAALDDAGNEGFTIGTFLKARSIIVPIHGKRPAAAGDDLVNDAMIEYHALREGAPIE
mgnify:CR=1 FL=1